MQRKSDPRRERAQRAMDKMVMRQTLPDVIGHIGKLLENPFEAKAILEQSRGVADYLATIAERTKNLTGIENGHSVRVLGMISDLALGRMTREEKKSRVMDNPSQIVLWFKDYLVRTQDKRDLEWSSGGDPMVERAHEILDQSIH